MSPQQKAALKVLLHEVVDNGEPALIELVVAVLPPPLSLFANLIAKNINPQLLAQLDHAIDSL